MILKHIENPKKSAGKAERIRSLSDYMLNPESKGAEKCTLWGSFGMYRDTKTDLQNEMIAMSRCSTRSKDPLDHWILSFKEGERPTGEQVEAMVKQILRDFEMPDHQAFFALHEDTDNCHVHILLNRISPTDLKAKVINGGLYKIHAQKVVAKLAHDFGFEAEKNDRFTVNEQGQVVRNKSGADKGKNWEAEKHSAAADEESISERAKRELTEIFDSAQSWQDLHGQLAALGYRYEKSGSGAKVFFDDVAIKASDASRKRNAALGKLVKRLGEYEPADPDRQAADLKVQPRFELPEELRQTAWHEYRQAVREKKKGRKPAFDALRDKHTSTMQQLKEAQKAERQRIYGMGWKGRTDALNAMRAVMAAEHLAKRDMLKKRFAEEREAVKQRFKPLPRFQIWLLQVYGQEAVDFQNADQLPAATGERSGLAEPLDFSGVSTEKLRFGVVAFKRQDTGGTLFFDRVKKVTLNDKSDESIKLWLQYAVHKYGPRISIKGADQAFLEKAARVAADNGLRFEVVGSNAAAYKAAQRTVALKAAAEAAAAAQQAAEAQDVDLLVQKFKERIKPKAAKAAEKEKDQVKKPSPAPARSTGRDRGPGM